MKQLGLLAFLILALATLGSCLGLPIQAGAQTSTSVEVTVNCAGWADPSCTSDSMFSNCYRSRRSGFGVLGATQGSFTEVNFLDEDWRYDGSGWYEERCIARQTAKPSGGPATPPPPTPVQYGIRVTAIPTAMAPFQKRLVKTAFLPLETI